MNIRSGGQDYLLNNNLSRKVSRSSYNPDQVRQNFNNSLSEKSKKNNKLSLAIQKKINFTLSVLGDISAAIIEKKYKLVIDVIIGTPMFLLYGMKYEYNEFIYSVGKDIFKVELEKYYEATKIQEKKFIDNLERFGVKGRLAQASFYYIKQLCIKDNALDKNDEVINGMKYLEYKKYKDSRNIAIVDAVLDAVTPTYLSTILTSIRERVMPFHEEVYVVNDDGASENAYNLIRGSYIDIYTSGIDYSSGCDGVSSGDTGGSGVTVSIEAIDSVIRNLRWIVEWEKQMFQKLVVIYENTANEWDDKNYRRIEDTLRFIHGNLCVAFEECEEAMQTLTNKRNILEQYYTI